MPPDALPTRLFLGQACCCVRQADGAVQVLDRQGWVLVGENNTLAAQDVSRVAPGGDRRFWREGWGEF